MGLLIGLLAVWVLLAVLNWFGGLGLTIFSLLSGNSVQVLSGQLWRLVTAAFVHQIEGPGSVSHILFTLLMLYFFVPALEERWGARRLFTFLAGSAAFAYGVETLMFLVFRAFDLGIRPIWFGGMVMADAAVVAWALSNKNAVINLFFVLPMKPMHLVGLMAVFHVMRILAFDVGIEGTFAPFAAMGAGYLFGGDQSPVRRAYLKWKLRRLQAEVDSLSNKGRKKKKKGGGGPNLQLIQGGRDEDNGSMLN